MKYLTLLLTVSLIFGFTVMPIAAAECCASAIEKNDDPIIGAWSGDLYYAYYTQGGSMVDAHDYREYWFSPDGTAHEHWEYTITYRKSGDVVSTRADWELTWTRGQYDDGSIYYQCAMMEDPKCIHNVLPDGKDHIKVWVAVPKDAHPWTEYMYLVRETTEPLWFPIMGCDCTGSIHLTLYVADGDTGDLIADRPVAFCIEYEDEEYYYKHRETVKEGGVLTTWIPRETTKLYITTTATGYHVTKVTVEITEEDRKLGKKVWTINMEKSSTPQNTPPRNIFGCKIRPQKSRGEGYF